MPRAALLQNSIHTNPGRLKPQICQIKKNKIEHNKTKTNTLGSGLVAETEGGDEMERMISSISISFLNEIVL